MLVRGVELDVRDEGDREGRVVVFGHGLLASMAQDDDGGRVTAPVTPGDGVRLVRYDARGHGASGATHADGDYRWRALARDMLGVLDAVAGTAATAVLAGASMGSATALHAAVLAPDRVDALILVIPPTARRARRRQAALYRAGAALVAAAGMGPFVRMARLAPRPRILTGDLEPVHRAALDRMATLDRRVVPHVLRGAAASDLPASADLAAVAIPALILAWEGEAAAVMRWPALVDDFLARL